MIQEELNKANKALLDTMTKATKLVLARKKIPKNSDLIKSIKWEKKQNGWVLLANDYYEYASGGRKPKARKVPIKDLLSFIKDYNIRPRAGQDVNQLAFAIQTSIYKNGIKKKNYVLPVEDVTLDISAEGTAEIMSEVVAEAMYQAITNV